MSDQKSEYDENATWPVLTNRQVAHMPTAFFTRSKDLKLLRCQKPDKSRLKLNKKKKLSDEERFPNLDSEEIQQICDSTKKINTERSDKKCEKNFISLLSRHKLNAFKLLIV